MKKMIYRKFAAVAASAVILGAAVPSVPGGAELSGLFAVRASAAGSVVLNSSTGVLTLSGDVTKEQVQSFRDDTRVKKVIASDDCVLPADCSNLFDAEYDSYWTELVSVDLSGADASEVTSMKEMFCDCRALTSVDMSGMNAAKTANFESMFFACENLAAVGLSGFRAAAAENMGTMFFDCYALKELDLSGFDTSAVSDMSMIFGYCKELETIYVSENWTTAAVVREFDLFTGCDKLKGGSGTAYNENEQGKDRARIDGGASAPGYLTLKPGGSTVKKGDINGDDAVDKADLDLLARYIMKVSTDSSGKYDVNNDGKIDGRDLIRLRKIMQDNG